MGTPEPMKVVFLDVDGVLNPLPLPLEVNGKRLTTALYIDQSMVSNLRILIEDSEAKIVVSSTWKRQAGAMQCLRRELKAQDMKIFGKTPDFSRDRLTRATEIRKWLKKHPEVTHWVALDDRKLDIFDDVEFMKGHFVRTDPKVGLTQENVSQATKCLYTDPCEDSMSLEE